VLSAGDRIGPYTLERLLNRHGPAEVWVARTDAGERVALSVSPLGHQNEADALKVFQKNIDVAKLVRHPNLATVIDGGHADELRYIASDVPDTIDLARVLELARRRNAWPLAGTAGFIAMEISRALAYIHALTTPDGLPLYLVHRDVVPHNILIDRTGRVRLAEFVSSIESQALIKTASKDQTGLVAYLSPELASYGRADARSDVFALGSVFWELLAKHPPFRGTNDLEIIEAVRTASLPSIPPDVPRELALAAQACLQRAPHDRPMSHELSAQLAAATFGMSGANEEAVAELFEAVASSRSSKPSRTALLSSSEPEVTRVSDPPSAAAAAATRPERKNGDPFFDASRDGLAWEGQRFQVLAKLGAGGMGEVYRVRDRELDEVVALKLIPQESTSEMRSTERLKREVRLARKIASPHVCRIYDIVDLGDGQRGLTMALVEGTTLSEMMRQGVRVDYQRFARWGADVAEGLTAAHELEIIHRDLKPENVMIRADDRAVILDFGIAFSGDHIDQSIKLTQQGMIMGTPLYMSPEQLLNLPLDGRSDLFALGLMLAELVTGEVPMRGASYPELVEKRVTKPQKYHLADIDPAAPRALADVVDELMMVIAKDRPSDARLIAQRLRAFADGGIPPVEYLSKRPGTTLPITGPTEPAPPIPVPPPPSQSSARSIVFGLTAAAALLLVISVLFGKERNVDPILVLDAGVAAEAAKPDAAAAVQAPIDGGLSQKPDAGKPRTVIQPAEEM
jgi:serine/threonine-protein kinase